MGADSRVAAADQLAARHVLRVHHAGGDAFEVTVGAHTLRVDQPREHGGEDSGPTPTELFVVSLASCVAFFAGRYLRRHQVEGPLEVECEYWMAPDRPSRVGEVRIRVHAPGVPAAREAALLAVAEACTVHNTLRLPPTVSIELVSG